MAKKIIYAVLGALLIFGLLFLLWSWFFSGSSSTNQNTGTFGTASSTQGTGGTSSGQNTNGQSSLGNNATNGTIPLNGGNGTNGGSVSNSGLSEGSSGTVTFNTATPGVTFLNSGSIGSGAGNGSAFNPTSINNVSSASGGSAPSIFNPTSSGSGGLNLGTAVLAAGAAGAISCGIRAASIGAAAGAGTATGGAAAVSGVPVGGVALGILAANSTAQTSLQTGDQSTSFAGCIVNTLAKVALQQITASVVNWINSGFNGSPSFVTNYQQFFTNVADLAAGQFIQGTGLAFLCSPFQAQIKIAIAQSYANRGAQSCSLTKIISNVNSFMSGNFASGGWGGLVSFTTVPTNNPYGAFAYAQVGLANAQSTAAVNAASNISPTGFLNLQSVTCKGVTTLSASAVGSLNAAQTSQAAKSGAVPPTGCTTSVTTPGGAIAASLDKQLGSGTDQLGLANDLDQIINALTTQLVTKSLYSGLTSLSNPTTEDTASEAQDQALLADMQNNINIAQQYGAIEQGSISDIENAQSNLNNLSNCWSTTASSSPQAASDEAAAQAQIQTLQAQIDPLNQNITNANNEIAELEQFVTEATTVGSAADVQAVAASYSAAQTAQPFLAQSDVTTAQQNRTTLQAQMSSINTSTQSSLAQCQAGTP